MPRQLKIGVRVLFQPQNGGRVLFAATLSIKKGQSITLALFNRKRSCKKYSDPIWGLKKYSDPEGSPRI